MQEGQSLLLDTLVAMPATLAALVYGLFLTYFLVAERRRVGRALISLAGPDFVRRLHVARGIGELRTLLPGYLGAVTLINIGLGAATAAVFHLLGVPSPAAWGAAMTVLNFAPYLGPVVMNVAVLAVGIATFPDPSLAFFASAALASLNTIEGYFLTPLIVGRQVKAGALAIFLAVAFGAWLWGWAGALLATPVLITANVAVRVALEPGREPFASQPSR
ncbi:MAG: AI-2E family transporter [Pseudomonadota bacterium]